MRIVIAGAGAMGCRFGAALFAAGHEVLLLDGWAEHVAAINAAGLRVTDQTGTRVHSVPAALFPAVDPADLVIVFAKATATAAVADASAGAIGPATLVLTLQNGLGNIEALLAHVPASRLLAGTTTLGTELLGPGRIRALGSGETVLGPLPGEPSSGGALPKGASPGGASPGEPSPGEPSPGGPAAEGAGRVRAALCDAGMSVRVSPNALEVIWAKVAFNCVMNSLCSIASIPVSALARYAGFDALASSILDEIAAVALAEGVTVDTSAALRLMKAQFDPSASGDHLASMLQDLMNGRPTEIAHLNGAIADRAARHGLDAPVNRLITQLVSLLESTWPGRVNALHTGPH